MSSAALSRSWSPANGDECPQDADLPADKRHGKMYVLASGRQYCPHSAHEGSPIYEKDGKTQRVRPKEEVKGGTTKATKPEPDRKAARPERSGGHAVSGD